MAHLTDPFYTSSFTLCSSLGPYRPLSHSSSTQSSCETCRTAVFLIQHTLGPPLHPGQSHIPALSKSPGASSCLLCGVEVWAFFPSLDFSLLPCCQALHCSPWAPDSCLAYVCVIYCSAAAGLSPASGFSGCDSGGMRNWTSSVLMATLSGWSHLLKCSKVLQKSRRKEWVGQSSRINYLVIGSVTHVCLPAHLCFSLLTRGALLLIL